MKSRVVLIPCDSYDKELLYQKMREGLSLLGGLDKWIKKDEKVLLKLNLVRGAAAEKAITTHPAIVEVLARILKEDGYSHVSAGDSGGFGTSIKSMHELGLESVFKTYGVHEAEFSEAVPTDFPEGIQCRHFMMAKDIIDADAIISLPKMKTHALEHITGAVKNQYGCVQGVNKAIGHTKYPNADSFARMLVDLNRCVAPRLFILDGIVAMEGNGPASGDPTPMNVLLLATDPVALDTVFSHLVYLDPAIVPTIYYGQQMGLGTADEEQIEILTPEGEITFQEVQERYGNPSFDVVRKKARTKGIMGVIDIFRIFQKKPRINKNLCKKCGICVQTCPVEGKAVDFRDGRENPPSYDYKKCIRCFCCQEMCPHKAIYVK